MEKHQRHGNSMNEGSEALESIVCLGSWIVQIFLSFTSAFSSSLFGRVKPSNMVSTPQLGVPALGLGSAPSLRHSAAPSQAHFRVQPPEACLGRGCLCPPLRGAVWGRGCPCKSALKVLSPSRNQLSSASVAFTSPAPLNVPSRASNSNAHRGPLKWGAGGESRCWLWGKDGHSEGQGLT